MEEIAGCKIGESRWPGIFPFLGTTQLGNKHFSVYGYSCGMASCFTMMSSQLRGENGFYHANIVSCCYSHSISVVIREVGSSNPNDKIAHNIVTSSLCSHCSCSSWGLVSHQYQQFCLNIYFKKVKVDLITCVDIVNEFITFLQKLQKLMTKTCTVYKIVAI